MTKGVGASDGNDYPSLLSLALNHEVINAGVPGNTTADGLLRLEQDVLSQDPKLVIVAFGGNDFLRRIPREKTFSNLDKIVHRIQEAGSMVVLVGVRTSLLRNSANANFKKIARDRKALYTSDMLKGVFTKPGLMSDPIHPNDDGYKIIAERIYKVVEPLLN